MSASRRFRDSIRAYLTKWLSDRGQSVDGRTAGFRWVWGMVAPLDAFTDSMTQGIKAAWPGGGTPSALPHIGSSRGIIRGQGESDENYAARLVPWLDRWRRAGSAEAVALGIHEYLADHPKVRVVNRAGRMVTVDTDGTVTVDDVAWDWDSLSTPDHLGRWWELWIIVYPTSTLAEAGDWGDTDDQYWGGDLGFGHDATRADVDAILALVRQWKSAHTFVRAIVFSYNADLFDPSDVSTMPDGTWGKCFVTNGLGHALPSSRVRNDVRIWDEIA